jgi:hypothetical protein
MIARNHIFEIEFIEKTVLLAYRRTHHRSALLRFSRNRESRRANDLNRLLQHSRRFADNRRSYGGAGNRHSAFIVGISLLAASSVVALVLGAVKYGLFEAAIR